MIFWIFFLFIVFITSCQYYYNGRKIGKSLSIIGIVFIIIVTGIRYDIGFDYETYYKMLYPALSPDILKLEPGSQIIMFTAHFTGWPPTVFLLYSFFTYGLVYYTFYKKSQNLWISLIVYVAFFYFSTLSTIRQGLAMSIVIYALPSLYSKNYKQYIILCIIAASMHLSAILCVSFITIYNIKKFKNVLLIFILCYVIAAFAINFLLGSGAKVGYSWYLNKVESYEGGQKIMYILLITSILCLWYSFRIKNMMALKMSFICIVGYIWPLFLGPHLGGRLASYYYLNFCFLIPVLVKNRVRLNYIVSIFCGIYFITMLYVDSQNSKKSSLTPYTTIFTVDWNNPKWKVNH